MFIDEDPVVVCADDEREKVKVWVWVGLDN